MGQKVEKEQDLEKVYVDLPNHWAVGGESMWAKPFGQDLYEIHNTPFYAYGINYLDIVSVDSSDSTKNPIVLEVIKPSGYITLRVYFEKDIVKEKQLKLFEELKSFGVGFERLDNNYVAIDVEPMGDYESVFDKLTLWEDQKILGFETCGQKVQGSFSEVSEENE